MEFYTDGSRIGIINSDEGTYLGWAAVCDSGVVCTGSQQSGSK